MDLLRLARRVALGKPQPEDGWTVVEKLHDPPEEDVTHE
jgi:hypothetical protein